MMYSHLIHETVVAERERELERALHEARVRRQRLDGSSPHEPARRRFRILGLAFAVTRR